MATGYRGARDHLDDIIRLARLVFIRGDHAAPDGIARHDLELVELGEIIEARMAASEPPLPLDRVRNAFQLEATEQRCLWLAIAYAVAADVRISSGCPGGLPLEVYDRAVYASPKLRNRFIEELGPHGRLLRFGLLELDESDGSRFGRIARAADAVVELAYGSDRLGDDVSGFAALVDPPQSELLVDLEVIHSIRRLLREQIIEAAGRFRSCAGPSAQVSELCWRRSRTSSMLAR